jgi:hypothetical protein
MGHMLPYGKSPQAEVVQKTGYGSHRQEAGKKLIDDAIRIGQATKARNAAKKRPRPTP